MWVHRITEKNIETRSGICANCGPVRLINKSNGRWACFKAAQAEYRKRDYKKRYGIDITAVAVPGKCEVCGSSTKICYDHDHATGKHRGWICDRCNRALGLVKDDAALLRALADYLNK